MKKVFVQTYGCQMNLADSEEMLSHLSVRGYLPTDRLEKADAVLINTCTVRDHAEHKAVSFLGRLGAWKKERPGRVIIFTGCAAERLGEKLKKQFPLLFRDSFSSLFVEYRHGRSFLTPTRSR